MNIKAIIRNSGSSQSIAVSTEGNVKSIDIPVRTTGGGSSVNGGELLFLALATCFCNDLYREATKRQMTLESVDVTVSGEFGKEGEPGRNIRYSVEVRAPDHSANEIVDLINYVDSIAEIHNTLRQGVEVVLHSQY